MPKWKLLFLVQISRKDIAEMIVWHEYTLSCVEHQGFKKVLSSLSLMWKHVSRNTIRKK